MGAGGEADAGVATALATALATAGAGLGTGTAGTAGAGVATAVVESGFTIVGPALGTGDGLASTATGAPVIKDGSLPRTELRSRSNAVGSGEANGEASGDGETVFAVATVVRNIKM